MADAVFVLGEDVSNTAPMLELALRQSVLRKPAAIAEKMHIEPWNDAPFREAIGQEKGPLFIAACNGTLLDDSCDRYIPSLHLMTWPAWVLRLRMRLTQNRRQCRILRRKLLAIAKRIADDLKNAKRPVVISGTTCGNKSIIQAAANIANALHKCGKKPQICFTAQCCNSIGMAMLEGKPLSDAVEVIESGSADTVIILENDIASDIAERIFKAAKNIIAIDSLNNKTTEKAHFVLPAATFAESDGTFVNNEGQGTAIFQGFCPGRGHSGQLAMGP